MARDRSAWRRHLTKDLQRAAKEAGVGPGDLSRMLMVELGLFTLASRAPGEAAQDAWALLSGYDLRGSRRRSGRLPGAVRWLIGELKSERAWRDALEGYQQVPEHLRLFDVADSSAPPVPREVSIGQRRSETYAEALAALPAHRPESPRLTEADVRYRVRMRRSERNIVIPADVMPPPAPGHPRHRKRRPIRLTWAALEATAQRMDQTDAESGERNNWHGRIRDLELLVRGTRGLKRARRLRLEHMVHIVGMPAVGKTTLLLVAAVWAANHGHALTLVLGDVVSVLNTVRDLGRYGVKAAPILGAATRGRHLQQLHRPADPTTRGLVLLDDPRLRWVSTSCTLQGLLDLSAPWNLGDAPCDRRIEQWQEDDEEQQAATQARAYACSLFGACGRHEAARELVTAPIWVATAPSLLHCRVPAQLTDTALRYLELAWLRSDAFLLDEADRIQIQWDQAFSPSQTLAGPGSDAWLDEVRPMFDQHIRRTQGQHLTTSSSVRDWSIDINSASMLVARLRALMAEHAHVREWLREGYFNEWRLGVRLATEIARRPQPPPDDTPSTEAPLDGDGWVTDETCRKQWLDVFAEWMQKPATRYTGDNTRVAFLRDVSARGYENPEAITKELHEWLERQADVVITGKEALERLAVRFQVTMVIALLADKLSLLTRACWEVENETGLESMSSSLVHRPPAEYVPLVPESPMGNLLAFQYREYDNAQPDQLGTLSFFRCAGIGRWLLLQLPHLYREAYPGPGPAAVLLSATSWAGNSPRYDVQAPVTAVLRSRVGEQVPVDERIVMDYLPFTVTDHRNREHPVRVSGQHGERRIAALRAVLSGLCKARSGLRCPRPSVLEEIRNELPEQRQRLLLLVGSYRESEEVLRDLVRMRPEWADQVLQMVPDDESGTHYWSAGTIARGNIHTLAQHSGVWLLIAPQLAIERGHNILNDDFVAALGATVYLVRPHLHPEDLSYHVQSMDRWAVEEIRARTPSAGPASLPLGKRTRLFRQLAGRRWMDMLEESLRYSLTGRDSPERRAMDWTNIPPLNQVIGRMLRGGATARVYFCDAAFDPASNDSPLVGMYRALEEAFRGPDADIATTLYRPLHQALRTLLEKHRADL